MRALKRRGMTVQPFKCGPITSIPPFTWRPQDGRATISTPGACERELIGDLIGKAAVDADICIAEGVMGLFDGARGAGRCGNGSTADLAALTGWPVILVLDVSAQAETAAAVALGCRVYRDDIRLAGVILNRVAGPGHADLIRPAIERIGLPVLGAVFRRGNLVLPDRHLGLVQASELAGIENYLDALSETITANVSLDALVSCARPAALSGASIAAGSEAAYSAARTAHRTGPGPGVLLYIPACLEGVA